MTSGHAYSRAVSRGRRPPLTAMRFVVGFGVVSALADIVYEGARSVYGPFLASLGATALVVSVVTGGGEAVALVARLLFGRLADARARRWTLAIVGYGLTALAVPLLGLTTALWMAVVLILLERLGKAVRSPAKDAMLAQAGTVTGRGWAFAIHEAMDQTGAFLGPLLIAASLALTASFGPGFLLLAIPGIAAILVLVYLRRRVPDTSVFEPVDQTRPPDELSREPLPRAFWIYAAFTALTMAGFATFGLLSFHLVEMGTVSVAIVPVVYAVAMGVDALAALGSGRLYDRIGIRGLIVLPILAAAIPWLGFSSSTAVVIAGMLIWGVVMGIQESTMRAAVADLVPDARRGSAYGIFTAVYGLAWLAGSIIIGVTYERSVVLSAVVVTVIQAGALIVFVVARPHRHHDRHVRG
ncbi:MAG: MFS transporter [Actinomycetota bacterium]